jgi:hypothetical protein
MKDEESPERKPVSLRKLQLELAALHESARAARNATPMVVDFSQEPDIVQHPSGRSRDPEIQRVSPEGFSLKGTQIRRRQRTARKRTGAIQSHFEAEVLYKKPLEEWDAEELARGRPRAADGTFRGKRPDWISGEVHEESMDRFKSIVKTGMRVAAVDAIQVVQDILVNEDIDNRGKPLVAASTKLQAAQFLIEHVVGKPTQRIENDVSVKLQAILAGVMVNPGDMATGNYMPAHLPGITMELAAMGTDEEKGDDDETWVLPE